MITRGYFIGEIIDSLGDIARQVDTRARINLNDLPVFVESFFKEVLNIVFEWNLRNLNAGKINFPGLDLGDAKAGLGIQITAQRTSQKVNETLKKVTDEALGQYPDVRVLIVGAKQGSYTIDAELAKRANFDDTKIMDVNDICKASMDLQIDRLQSLFELIRRETAKIKVELEIPDEDGQYPTTMFDYVEAIAVAKLPDFSIFTSDSLAKDWGISKKDAQKDFNELGESLAQIPRVTREFFAIMIERCEKDRKGILGNEFRLNTDILARIIRYPDWQGEIKILQEFDFISYDEPEHHNVSGYWSLCLPGLGSDKFPLLNEYIQDRNLSWRRVIVELDFTGF